MEKDIQALVEENRITADDNKAEFLMADYFVSYQVCLQILLIPKKNLDIKTAVQLCLSAKFTDFYQI